MPARPAVPPPPVRAAATPAPWPDTRLDVAALRRAGTRPVPLREFVLKVNSRCNLACSYCYVYAMADHGWRHRPAHIAGATVRQAARRIGEHARAHAVASVRLVLHGGEPLLSPVRTLAAHVDTVRRHLPDGCALSVTLQTNGTLLTPRTARELAAAGIRVGLSLDGGLARHNRARVDHAGRPSWPAAAEGLRLLARHPEIYAGVLCTVDVAADPVEVYESLLGFAPPALDLLLPLGTWTDPPPALPPASRHAPRARTGTPYGDWLCAVFDHWFDAGRTRAPGTREPGTHHPRIRLFEEILVLLLGAPAATEAIGLSPSACAVVETDGAIEQTDALKSAYDGAAATGLDVFRHTFDDALEHPGFAARQIGASALAPVCRGCPVGRVCGGGHYPHRYAAGSGFRNPSVYCADLERTIRHVARRLAGSARPAVAAG
jgi:uncharacterized protein